MGIQGCRQARQEVMHALPLFVFLGSYAVSLVAGYVMAPEDVSLSCFSFVHKIYWWFVDFCIHKCRLLCPVCRQFSAARWGTADGDVVGASLTG